MRLLSLSFFLISYFFVNAQNYRPFISGEKCWLTYAKDDFTIPPQEDIFHDFLSLTEGDTVSFNGEVYHNLWVINSVNPDLNELRGLIREDTTELKVWYIDINNQYNGFSCIDDSTEILLYDFSAIIGDTVAICNDEFYSISEMFPIDEYYLPYGGVIYDTLSPPLLSLVGEQGELSYEFIYEGIGSNHGILPYPLNTSEYYFIPYLKMFSTDPAKCSLPFVDNISDIDSPKWSVQPNPFRSYLQIELVDISTNLKVELYNLVGQLVLSTDYSEYLKMHQLNPGYYFLTLRNNDGFSLGTQRVLKIN